MVDTTFKWEKSNKIIRVSKPDFLPKIKDFEIIFVNLCSILSFSKQNTYLSRKEVGKKQNFYFEKKKVLALIPIPKLDFVIAQGTVD